MQKKNEYVNFLRGLAMLLVVLGHTLQGCVNNATNSFLFQIIWTLQMPLFFLISGYVTRYSRSHPCTLRELAFYFKRKTYAYLFPFAIWTFLIRGVLFGQNDLLNIPHLVYSMDSGYWFLFSLWTMTLFFGIAEYLAGRISGNCQIKRVLLTVVFFAIEALALGALGLVCGLSFLCIKLTLYYIPLYLLGHLFGYLQDAIRNSTIWKKGVVIFPPICAVVWLFFITRYNMFTIADDIGGIILRFTVSLAGCIALCGLLAGIYSSLHHSKKLITFAGTHSLEIYLIHSLCLSTIRSDCELFTTQGIITVVINCIITLGICYIAIRLFHGNSFTRRLLFAK